jgi:hypothetical protein
MQIEATWWITAIEAPIVGALFWMIHGLRRDLHERIDRSDERESEVVSRTREDLSEFKLEVARTYVPLSLIRDVDRRLSGHLLRIEAKLDASMHAASMRGLPNARLATRPDAEDEG